jgi:hypothetical protein
MSDFDDRLRREAAATPPTHEQRLVGRTLAAMAIERARAGQPSPAPRTRPLLRLVAAGAGLAAAAGLAILVLPRPADEAVAPAVAAPRPAMVAPPPAAAAGVLDAVLLGPGDDELAALRADLAAVAGTLRGSLPF